MRPVSIAFFALAALLAAQGSASAGAWPVKHQWSDKARPNDPTSGSFGWEYARESVAVASSMTSHGAAYDCADFAITVLVDYAARHNLEVKWTLPDPDNHWQTHEVSSTEARFKTPAQFAKFSRDWINASMVATLNTSPISYDEWRSGDVVMMRWNQLGDENPFPGRDVWHTYFVGDPAKLIFYGNIDGEEGPNPTPLSIVATASPGTLDEVKTSKAVYGASPRRWNILVGNVIPPEIAISDAPAVLAPEEARVKAGALNVREAPTTHSRVIAVLHKGDTLSVEGKTKDGWVRVRRADESVAYVSASFVSITDVKLPYSVEGLPSTTSGLDGAIDGN